MDHRGKLENIAPVPVVEAFNAVFGRIVMDMIGWTIQVA
jgi:hypothetical protein